MHDRFLQIIKKHALKSQNELNLLAISGGVDSMVLWDLMESSGVPYAVAHCNFQLRGEESVEDEVFVQKKAESLGVECHIKKFDTNSYATINKVSTQMAARDLRYTWFEDLCLQYGYTRVVLAHHANDNAETVLLNLVRGTSIRGLSGMSERSEKRFRPLLSFTKEELVAYAEGHGIRWREDRSNSELYYKRNYLRKEVIPLLETLNPDFLTTMSRNISKNSEVDHLTKQAITRLKGQILLSQGEDQWSIKKQDLSTNEVGPYVLSELLSGFGFNYYQSEQILDSIDGLSGKNFASLTHELIIDRDALLIRSISDQVLSSVSVNRGDDLKVGESEYLAEILESADFEIDTDPSNAMFDLDKLNFPLVMRPWQEGDRFQPLGMKGQKLVSDLLIDQKVTLFDKGSVQVLCSSSEIIWVVGMRISDKFKVTSKSKSVLYYRLNGG